MKGLFNSYKSSLILLAAIIIGGIAGLIYGPKTAIVKPFGDLFLHLFRLVRIPIRMDPYLAAF
ncbi:hypothetical protein F4V44_23400 [Niallia endozanthoxylica]|uniref:Dicarboxylate/amino acid:cation symporter n=1 Tax=Niallia endozanthoxylica TaxID=2036016 RepID=A0A5J5H1W2_9BACI|nr:hypothetical protein F4V44_23400 [Niallia endozanthoxylica]